MIWLRRVGAVFLGFFSVALPSVATDALCHAVGLFPPEGERMADALFVIPAIYRAFYTAVGGALTARLAPDHVGRHLGVLTVLGLLGGLGGLMAWQQGGPAMGPLWYAASIPLSAVPCILGGGYLARR